MSVRRERRLLERARVAEGQRLVLRAELRHLPQRILAPIIGISRGSLRKFLAMSVPGRATRVCIRQWCADRPEPDVPLGAVALALLAREFRVSLRPAVRRRLAQTLAELFVEAGTQPPPWLREEVGPTRKHPP